MEIMQRDILKLLILILQPDAPHNAVVLVLCIQLDPVECVHITALHRQVRGWARVQARGATVLVYTPDHAK